jgi:hypothetical protein
MQLEQEFKKILERPWRNNPQVTLWDMLPEKYREIRTTSYTLTERLKLKAEIAVDIRALRPTRSSARQAELLSLLQLILVPHGNLTVKEALEDAKWRADRISQQKPFMNKKH